MTGARTRRRAARGLVALATALSAPLAAPAAHAADLDLGVVGPSGAHDLAPGDSVTWQVRLEPSTKVAESEVRTSAVGPLADLPGALRLEVRSCDEPWTARTCGGQERTWLADGPADRVGAETVLGRTSASGPTWFLVTVRVPATAGNDAQGRQVHLELGARGRLDETAPRPGDDGPPRTRPPREPGDEPSDRPTPTAPEPPGPRLAHTGFALLSTLALGLAASGTGVLLSAAARRRRADGARR